MVFDASAFLFILLTFMVSIKIYDMTKLRDCLWLVSATAYGTILRGMHLVRNWGWAVPDALTVSRLFGLFYILLFLGVLAYYKPIKDMWDETHKKI